MAEQLSYGIFPIIPAAMTNDADRPGSLLLEYFEVKATITSNAKDVEVPTTLGEVKGLIPLHYASTFDSGDSMVSYTTDGVISSSAVTLRLVTASIPDGTELTVRGFLVGTKSETQLSLG